MAPESKGLSTRNQLYQISFISLFFICVSCHAKSDKNHTVYHINENNMKSIFPSNIQSHSSGNISSPNDYLDPGEILTRVLINHTMVHGGKEDLDNLIFSTIPDGTKLVLQSVKVYQTDEHGNPIDSSTHKYPVHWDLKLTNATELEEDDDEDEGSGEEEVEDDEHQQTEDKEHKTLDSDLEISGSHAQENYKMYGSNNQVKDKSVKNYYGVDHGKLKKVTNTDTDGLKLTKYKGKEHGVKDHDSDQAKKLHDERERYKDSKRKNKGRRVSGFKRVYHKEEFQRTEHFWNDQDAKSVAEAFGNKVKTEVSKNGLKDDDRKFHGHKVEHLDGNKVKNEKGTSHGIHKGKLTEYKDGEQHKHSTHYNKAGGHSSGGRYYSPQQSYYQHHPNHRATHSYHGSHSNPANTVVLHPPPRTLASLFQNGPNGEIAKIPMTASFVVEELQGDSSTISSTATDVPMTRSKPTKRNKSVSSSLKNAEEVKVYFSPRDRHVDRTIPAGFMSSGSHYYTGPSVIPRTTFRSKIGNFSEEDSTVRGNYSNYYRNPNGTYGNGERYARKFHASTVRNTLLDASPGGYSTLIKLLPVNYINLGDDESQSASSIRDLEHNKTDTFQNAPQVPIPSSSVESITFTTNSPPVLRRPRPPSRGRWVSISFGDPEAVHDRPFIPHNKPLPHLRPLSISNLVQGVRQRLRPTRPFSHGARVPHQNNNNNVMQNHVDNQFDTSKYPPNVVVKNNGSNNNGRGGTFNANNNNHTENSSLHKPPIKIQNHNLVSMNSNKNSLHEYPWIKSRPHNNNFNNGIQTRPSSNSHGQRMPHPNQNRHRTPHSLPPFMNNLMDSVANFFSNVG